MIPIRTQNSAIDQSYMGEELHRTRVFVRYVHVGPGDRS